MNKEDRMFVIRHYEKDGYICFFPDKNAIYGVFDIIAKKKDELVRWIHIANRHLSTVNLNKIRRLKIWDYTDVVELWLKVKKGYWKIYWLSDGDFHEHKRIIRGRIYQNQEAKMREIARLEPKDGIYTARAEVVNLLLRVGLSEKDVEKIIKKIDSIEMKHDC